MNAFKLTIAAMTVATVGIMAYATIADAHYRAHKNDVKETSAPVGTFDSSSLLVNAQPEPNTNYFATIEAGAIDFNVNIDTAPGLVSKLGQAEIDRLRDGLSAAAFRTAKAPICDTVSNVSFSYNSEAGNPVIYSTCRNGKKWYFHEEELKDKDGNWFTASTAITATQSWDSSAK